MWIIKQYSPKSDNSLPLISKYPLSTVISHTCGHCPSLKVTNCKYQHLLQPKQFTTLRTLLNKSYLRVVKIFILLWLRNVVIGIRYCVTGYVDRDVSIYRSFFETSDSNVILQENGKSLYFEEREIQDKAAWSPSQHNEEAARLLLATRLAKDSAISCRCAIRVASDARETLEKYLNGTCTNLGQLKHECVNFTNTKMVTALSTFCTTRSPYFLYLLYESNKKRRININVAHKFLTVSERKWRNRRRLTLWLETHKLHQFT